MHVGRRGGGGGAESGSGSSHKNATNRFSQLAKSEIKFYWRQAFSRNFSDRSFLAFSNLNAPVPQAVHGCEIFNRLISSVLVTHSHVKQNTHEITNNLQAQKALNK